MLANHKVMATQYMHIINMDSSTLEKDKSIAASSIDRTQDR
jgi:hypothetical protein